MYICTYILCSVISTSESLSNGKNSLAFSAQGGEAKRNASMKTLGSDGSFIPTSYQALQKHKVVWFPSYALRAYNTLPCFWRKMLIEEEVVQSQSCSFPSLSNELAPVTSPSSVGGKTCCNSIEHNCTADIAVIIQPSLRCRIIAAILKSSGSRFLLSLFLFFFCRYWNLQILVSFYVQLQFPSAKLNPRERQEK